MFILYSQQKLSSSETSVDVGTKTSGGVTIVNLNSSSDQTAATPAIAAKASGVVVNTLAGNSSTQHSAIISADAATSTTTVSVASSNTHATTGRSHKNKLSRSSPSSPKDPYRRTIFTGNIKIRK